MSDFVDFYEFLGVPPDATDAHIQDALRTTRLAVEAMLAVPAKRVEAQRYLIILTAASDNLSDPANRALYDRERLNELVQRINREGYGALVFDPPYELDINDPEQMDTVAELMHRYDAEWERGINDVKSHRLEVQLRNYRSNDLYQTFEEQVQRLRVALAAQYPDQMLESLIALCLSDIERPIGSIADQAIAEVNLPPSVVRPDRDTTLSVVLTHGGERGCLFGYVQALDAWGSVITPRAQAVTWFDDAHTTTPVTQNRAYFSLRPGQTVRVEIALKAQNLLQLSRPQAHVLPVEFVTQIGTPVQLSQTLSYPVQVTLLPARMQLEPEAVTLPSVRRGTLTEVHFIVHNSGEMPLNAEVTKRSDDIVAVTPSVLPNGGQVMLKIDTQSVPYGAAYQKTVRLRADGDTPDAVFTVKGEVLPTAFQAAFRQQHARDRLLLSFLGGLGGALFSLGTNIALIHAWFWVPWLALAGAAAAGTTYWSIKHIVKYIQASGDTDFTIASINWPWAMGVAASVAVIIGLIAALEPRSSTEKVLTMCYLLSAIGIAFGFFSNDTWVILQHTAQPGEGGITRRVTPQNLPNLRSALLIVCALVAIISIVAIIANLWQTLLIIAIILVIIATLAG